MSKTRAQRADALEVWADRFESTHLVEADTAILPLIDELADHDSIDEQLTEVVRLARDEKR